MLIFILSSGFSLKGQSFTDLWEDVPESSFVQVEKQQTYPNEYRTLRLDGQQMKRLLSNAPHEEKTRVKNSDLILHIPLPEGGHESFRIVEYSMMEAGLAKQYPEITTYLGVGVDAPGKNIRFSWSPLGFNATVHSAEGSYIITSGSLKSTQEYICFYRKDYPRKNRAFKCLTEHKALNEPIADSPSRTSIGCKFRTYKLAVATTGEYSLNFQSNPQLVLSGVTNTINTVNQIFERDLGVRFILVENTDQLFQYDPATDPFSNPLNLSLFPDPLSNDFADNQNLIDNIIGEDNYDIGHLFGDSSPDESYGLVDISGTICNLNINNPLISKAKARAVSLHTNPGWTSSFAVNVVAHELGHQLGGSHTQNSDCEMATTTAMEPGSGSTIMAYAGFCNVPSNEIIQENHDDYLHGVNIEQIDAMLEGSLSSCGTLHSTNGNNAAPEVDFDMSEVILPPDTPVKLHANGTDADGDFLTYCWEQWDPEVGEVMPPQGTNANGPLFRSFEPNSGTSRYLPNINAIVNGFSPKWEKLPLVDRSLEFNVTVRDNSDIYGCVAQKRMQFDVDASTGPFRVLAPNGGESFVTETGNFITVDWSDNTASICSEVNIRLSVDGGFTYPYTLESNIPNSFGSYNVVLPEELTDISTARIMVECADNSDFTFFDISDGNFSFAPCVEPTDIYVNNGETLIYDTPQKVNGNIYVEPGGMLIIRSTVEFTENSRIIVRRRGKLHVDGGVLTQCGPGDFWQGILAAGSPFKPQTTSAFDNPPIPGSSIVLVNNGGKIMWAETGIADGRPVSEGSSANYYGALVHCENADFLNCKVAVDLHPYELINDIRFINCLFEAKDSDAEEIGIRINGQKSVLVDNCDFEHLSRACILSYDSELSVQNGCSFTQSGGLGIAASTTSPFASGGQLYVGPGGGQRNSFEKIDLGIKLNSIETALIEENDFSSNYDGIIIYGESNALIQENKFSGNSFSIFVIDSKEGRIDITCNDFDDHLIDFPTLFSGINDGTYLSRNFFDSQFGNIILDSGGDNYLASIGEMQGKPADPARNCFTPNSTEHIWTFYTTKHFNYFVPDNNALSCEEPDDAAIGSNNYTVQETNWTDFENCPLFFPEEEPPPGQGCDLSAYLSKKNDFDTWFTAYQSHPNDLNALQHLLEAEGLKNGVLRCLIKEGIRNSDGTVAEQALDYEGTARALRWKFGLRVELGDLSGAQQLLNTLPSAPLEDEDAQFRVLQEINLARLSAGTTYELNDEQKEQLRYIADLHSPERGYAHALLSLLDGQEFWDSYELPQSFSLPQPNFQQEQEYQGLWVYPNPSNGQVKLRLPEYINEGETVSLQVFGLDGRQIEERQLNTVRSTLDFSNLNPGLYLLEAWGRNGALGKAVITIF